MKDLGQEAFEDMNRLLLNQKRLKMKLERMGDKQIADLSKKVERLQEQLDIVTEQRNDIHIDKQVLQKQLDEANEVIKTTNRLSGNIDLSQLVYEDRRNIDGITMQTESYLEKWGVK